MANAIDDRRFSVNAAAIPRESETPVTDGQSAVAWNTVIAGVDRSPEAANAASFAWEIARRAQSTMRLVNVTRVVPVPPTGGGPLIVYLTSTVSSGTPVE